jgi:carbon monoxide dehydrogenase subunit G
MEFSRELVVAANAATSWDVLTDVPRLVGWVSIVDDAKELSHLEQYSAVLMDRIGPFKLRADLDITVSEVVPGQHIRVRASGEDRQVSSRIGIDATLTLDERADGGTTVRVDGTYEVVGRVATLGAGMIKQKAAKILDEFFGRAGDELGAT